MQTFEEVNWTVEMPDYSAVKHLLDDDFVWDWTPTCTRQYDAVVAMSGVVHVKHPPPAPTPRPVEVNAVNDVAVEPCPSLKAEGQSSGGVIIGRPPPTVWTSSSSSEDSAPLRPYDCNGACDDPDCDLYDDACATM